ncbi:hypothetical protein AG1IA_10328 [Rhizoctonia solani AG-1 IA]|uniref:Uncharacterized protein n=1 Tax=Thanatephorus cucumeris (strain AG1-IA) TaxID=983506 RepID=L8WFZ3_THACA|nr:hypothetical protein AG1IA_10328 [Rhizoctonia solani AG-1 IA]
MFSNCIWYSLAGFILTIQPSTTILLFHTEVGRRVAGDDSMLKVITVNELHKFPTA